MILRVLIAKISDPRGTRVGGLIWYLFGPGRREEHTDPPRRKTGCCPMTSGRRSPPTSCTAPACPLTARKTTPSAGSPSAGSPPRRRPHPHRGDARPPGRRQAAAVE